MVGYSLPSSRLLLKTRAQEAKQVAKVIEPGLCATNVLHRSQRDTWYHWAEGRRRKVQWVGKGFRGERRAI